MRGDRLYSPRSSVEPEAVGDCTHDVYERVGGAMESPAADCGCGGSWFEE